MGNVVIQAQAGHINMTGAAFMTYGNRYREAAMVWLEHSDLEGRFDPIIYQLLCQSLELHLKSFIWLKEQIAGNTIKNRYGHNIEKLWEHSKARGINRYAKVSQRRDDVIALLGPYYKNRKFCYLDLDMVVGGFNNLRSQPHAVTTMVKLTQQLGRSLKQPILRAS